MAALAHRVTPGIDELLTADRNFYSFDAWGLAANPGCPPPRGDHSGRPVAAVVLVMDRKIRSSTMRVTPGCRLLEFGFVTNPAHLYFSRGRSGTRISCTTPATKQESGAFCDRLFQFHRGDEVELIDQERVPHCHLDVVRRRNS
ncbi:MAG: hypothetical protein ACRDRG_07935 [Pseudonocardiaceae bacterium]